MQNGHFNLENGTFLLNTYILTNRYFQVKTFIGYPTRAPAFVIYTPIKSYRVNKACYENMFNIHHCSPRTVYMNIHIARGLEMKE